MEIENIDPTLIYKNLTWIETIKAYWKEHENLLREAKEILNPQISSSFSSPPIDTINEPTLSISTTILSKLNVYLLTFFQDFSSILLGKENYDVYKRLFVEFKHLEFKFIIPATVFNWILTYIDLQCLKNNGDILNLMIDNKTTYELVLPFLYYSILLEILKFLVNIFVGILFAQANHNLNMKMRMRFFESILRQDYSFFEIEGSNQINNRLANESNVIKTVLNSTINDILQNTTKVAFGLYFMLNSSVTLTVISLLFAPLSIKLTEKTNKIVGLYGVVQNDAISKANLISSECINNMRTVKAHNAEKIEFRRYKTYLDKYLKVIMYSLFSETTLRFFGMLLASINGWIYNFVGYFFILNQQMSLGDFHSFGGFKGQYTSGFGGLQSYFTNLSKSRDTCRQFFDLLDRKSHIINGSTKLEEMKIAEEGEEIVFSNVSFTYPTRKEDPVLNKVSFSIKKGDVVALIGSSGVGKSTCFNLIERFYDCTSGKITVDNFELKSLDEKSWRQSIGFVSQEPVLFNRSIAENIIFGMSPMPSKELIIEAAKLANAHDFIMKLDDGYLTKCGSGGNFLSGGQKQRIAIARALIRKPSILLLDEATSSLDSLSESLVQQALQTLMIGRTTIIIAHRLSTIKKANKIIVLDEGQVKETGIHEELMKDENSLYFKFVGIQENVSHQKSEREIDIEKEIDLVKLKAKIKELEAKIKEYEKQEL